MKNKFTPLHQRSDIFIAGDRDFNVQSNLMTPTEGINTLDPWLPLEQLRQTVPINLEISTI